MHQGHIPLSSRCTTIREQSLVIWKPSSGTCSDSDVSARPRFVSQIIRVLSSAPNETTWYVFLVLVLYFLWYGMFKLHLRSTASSILKVVPYCCYSLALCEFILLIYLLFIGHKFTFIKSALVHRNKMVDKLTNNKPILP